MTITYPPTIQKYCELIDSFVETAKGGVLARRIRMHRHAERTNDDDLPLTEVDLHRKTVLLAMTDEQRAVIVELLEDCQKGAVHDALSDLEWWVTSGGGLKLSIEGEELNYESFSGDMRFDFHARFDGESWESMGR